MMKKPLTSTFHWKTNPISYPKGHIFLAIVLLIALSGFSVDEGEEHAFNLLFTETFESDGNGSTYRANTFNDGTGDVWVRWDIGTFPAGPNATTTTSGRNFFQAYSDQQGSYAFGGEDMDATDNPLGTGKPGYITFQTLDVSAYQGGNAKIELLLGASTELNSRYETGDYLTIEYAFDTDISTGTTTAGNVPSEANLETGTYSVGGAFRGGAGTSGAASDLTQDTNLDGSPNPGASTLTTTLTDHNFTFTIPATATTMSVRIVALGGTAEEVVVDNVRISAETGGPAIPSLATVAAKAFLEGAYNGSSLNTTINGSIPSAQPYSGATYNNHSGTESASAPASAVDWVLVELREAGSAAAALNSTKVGSAAGFLMSDGSIKATDGTSDLTISLSGNTGSDFYVVVYHRNHLPIMSAAAVSESSGTYSIDFTSNSANTYQTTTALKSLSGGKFGLPAGDSDQDGDIDATDLSTWRANNGTDFSYGSSGAADFNLDGVINAVDRNAFHHKNTSKTRQVPSS
ncbi:MAG: hypothetical protein Roseis2KO_44080 [Roseivirga sp.]